MSENEKSLSVITGAILFVILFYIFYPQIYTTQDEANYFDFAYRLRQATIYFEPIYSHKVIFNGKGHVDMYPPGMALLLFPLTFFSWKMLFLLNPILHLLAFLAFYRILKLLNIDKRFSVLYLFFPSFILYTRTLSADMASASLITIALYFYFKKHPRPLFFSGLLLGLSCLVKYSNFVIALLLILFLLVKNRSRVAYIIIGFLPFLVLVLAYNHFAYGHILKTGYAYIMAGRAFGLEYFFRNFIFYITTLLIIYPFMLPAAFIYKKLYKKEILVITLSMLIVFSLWHYIQASPSVNYLVELVVGMRLLLPIIPLLLLSYSGAISRIFEKTKRHHVALGGLTLILIMVSAFAISLKHQQYLDTLSTYRQAIYSNVPDNSIIVCDGETTKFIQNAWGNIGHKSLRLGNVKALIASNKNVYVVVVLRFDKQQDANRKLKEISLIANKYRLKLLYESKNYFDFRIYKI